MLALALRVALFPIADNKLGDAPIRSLIAQRMNDERGLASEPAEYRQFGPLHIAAMRPFLLIDGDLSRASRWLSLLAGLAVMFPFLSLAQRLCGRPAATMAGLALACSPLHIQASITAGSEALYVLVLVVALERLCVALEEPQNTPRTFVVAGVWAGLAAVTRYDSWIALPAVVVAAAVAAKGQKRLGGIAIFAGTAALLPAGWLIWSGVKTGTPLALFHTIAGFHAEAGRDLRDRLGPFASGARQAAIWVFGLAAAMTPGSLAGLVGFGAGFGRWAKESRRAKVLGPGFVVAIAAWAPIAVYLVRGIAQGAFEPLARFALAPGVLLLPFAAAGLTALSRRPRWVAGAVIGGGLAMGATTMAVMWASPAGQWPGLEAVSPVTRLDPDDRAVAEHLRSHRKLGEGVFIDTIDYADIAITAAAGVPARQSASLVIARAPEATLAATVARTGATWVAARDDSWLLRPEFARGWPVGATRLGRWRIARIEASGKP